MEDIVNIIQNVGFPIAIVVYLLYHDVQKDAQHKEEMDNMSKSFSSLELAITSLNELIKEKLK